jgi:hypothetical protein
MPIENLLQEINLVATLAGILAGFAFSAVIQLLGSNPNSRLTSLTVMLFTFATLIFLYT